ncbi:MAG: hypothetical protein RBR97_19165 [Bacteroidales bacterium]|nr:hypothetical protein [Bacteroidales bacterium]
MAHNKSVRDGYLDECIAITGAVIDGDYKDYSNGGGYFTPDGEIIDNGNQHPYFELAPDEIIQLEFSGVLESQKTVNEWIVYLQASTPFFNQA